MIEYIRLLGGDWWRRLTTDWTQHDTYLLLGVLAGIIVIGLLLTKRR